MTPASSLRFIYLGILWITSGFLIDGKFVKTERYDTPEHDDEISRNDPANTLLKMLKDLRLSTQLDGASKINPSVQCSPSPFCSENYKLYKTEHQDKYGCFLYQCIRAQSTESDQTLDKMASDQDDAASCAAAICATGYHAEVTVLPQTTEECALYSCRPSARSFFQNTWSKCIMSGSVIDTVDQHVLNCFHACNVTLLEDKSGRLIVKVIKTCRERCCKRSVTITVKHPSFKVSQYHITLTPNLDVVISCGGREWTYSAERALLIASKFPFIAKYSGDTLVFEIPCWSLHVYWDIHMDATFKFQQDQTGVLRGACCFKCGMGPYGKRPGKLAPSPDLHLKSWRCGRCKILKCSKKNELLAWKICEIIRDKPFSQCQHVMDMCNYPLRCKDTVCKCLESGQRREACKCKALRTFTKKCLLAKVELSTILHDGLNAHKCIPRCPFDKTFVLCYKEPCQKKCETKDMEKCSKIEDICIMGCRCPKNMLDKAERCLTVSECRDCVCSGSNDGSFTTFDGQHFKFRSSCTFLVGRDNNNDFRLCVQNKHCAVNKEKYCGISVTLKTLNSKTYVIEKSTHFFDQNIVTVNSIRARLPYKDHLVYIIPVVDGAQLLVRNIQLLITVTADPTKSGVFHFRIRLPSALYGKKTNCIQGLCGQCGPKGGHKSLKLRTRQTTVTSDIREFAESWLAYNVATEYLEEKFDITCIGNISKPCHIIDRKEEKICAMIFHLKRTVFSHCIKDPAPYYEECKELICIEETLYDKRNLACRIWQEYASDCCEETHRMGDWRKRAGCPRVRCRNQKIYRPCGPGCDATCVQPKCPEAVEWKEGCYCPPGTIRGAHGCILSSQCQICSGHKVGETWKNFQTCEECTCEASTRIVCEKMCPGPTPKCPWDQTLKGTKDSGGCCCECECIRPCPPPKQIRQCVKGEIIRTTITKCGCKECHCFCDLLMCRPKPTCNEFQQLLSMKLEDDCCEYHKCECIGAASCPSLQKPNCTDEQVMVENYDESKCCVIGYGCNCLDCPVIITKPKCRDDQLLCKLITPCGCVRYKCKCKKCPPRPNCGKYGRLEVCQKKKRCCPDYICKCKRGGCPNLDTNFGECEDDKEVSPIFDPSKCCIIRYECKCPKTCRPPRKPACCAGMKLVPATSVCNCKIYRCVCDTSICKPVPQCSQYQVLQDITEKKLPRPCCNKYICRCIKPSKCPKYTCIKCEGEKVPQDVYDDDNCCVVRQQCVCPEVCQIRPKPHCRKDQILITKITECNCKYQCCVCDKSKCPVCHCGPYEDIVTTETNSCCDKQYCECNYTKCKDVPADFSRCTEEEQLVPVFDPANCCIISYKCECQPCRKPKPKTCGPCEKLVTKLSKCKCPHHTCKCDPHKCTAPPTCGKYSMLVSFFKKPGDCCKVHECICDPSRCPQLDPRDTVCPAGKVQKAIIERTNCCVICYKCECLPCVRPSPKVCQPGERLKEEKDDCGCYRPICLCNGTTTCSKKPKCSKYQYLKTTSNPKDCCLIYTCECKGLSHCPIVILPRPCGKDEVMKEIYDLNDCCIIKRTCVCDKCKPSIQPGCGPFERVVNKPSKCCNHYCCECDSSKCPVKRCPPNHELCVYNVQGRCCPKQKCKCLIHTCPDPNLIKPNCRDEEEYAVEYDKAGCCPHHICKCPKRPCPPDNVSCGPYEKLVTKKTACHCSVSHCECCVSKCPFPPPCSEYQKLVKTEEPGSCCPKYFCTCDTKLCPNIKPSPEECTKEEWLKSVSDPNNCCTIDYKCVCNPCPVIPLPVCKPFQKLEVTKTKCDCDKSKCVCDDSIPCEPIPVCNLYQQLTESDSSNCCCKRYDCVCRGTSFCPKLPTPICKDEETVVEKIDNGNCCVIKKKCKCPKICPICPKPRCSKYEKLTPVRTKCCIRYKCVCCKSLCPKKICGQYQNIIVIPVPGRCCDKIQCECAAVKCPVNLIKPICLDEQTAVPKKDGCGCCIVDYKCKCKLCPIYPIPKCKKTEKIVKVKTPCGCLIPKCKCDYRKCPKKKICGKYQRLHVRKPKGQCCPICKCVCKRRFCPHTNPDPNRCVDEQMLVPIYDDKYCCVIDWKCECQPCPKYPKPVCGEGDEIAHIKSHCGCPVSVCVCSGIECPPRPVCGKYERPVEVPGGGSCCKKYECVCINISDCPEVPTPRCEDEEVIKELCGKCCVEKRICVCPDKCPEKSSLTTLCKECHRLVYKPTKCCMEYVCECDPSQCPIIQCPPAHLHVQTEVPGECCPKQECVCKPYLCPKTSPEQCVCHGDQRLVPVTDDARCCISYQCRCEPCPCPPKITCCPSEKIVEKRTVCNCPIYKCVCDKERCPKPPRCGKFARLKTVREENNCCSVYSCVCKCKIKNWKECRPCLSKPICKDEQVLMPFYDMKKCCIRKWVCVCCEKCPPCKKIVCDKDEKVIIVKSVCNCDKPLCVCRNDKDCNVKPVCTPYQDLIILDTSTKCCKRYDCECKRITLCPICKTPVCEDEEVIQEITDVNDCCVVKKICVCPKICPRFPYPHCEPHENVVAKDTKCCRRYCCECDIKRCPKKVCTGCMTLRCNYLHGVCCPQLTCVCNSSCCPIVPVPRCHDEQKAVAVYDFNNCCIIRYKCVCCKCVEKPKVCCGPYEKVVVKTSVCNCKTYCCECDPTTCHRPRKCGEFETLDVIQLKDECCPRYECNCNKLLCPNVVPKKVCEEHQVLKPMYDPNKCCIICYACVCTPCKQIKKPICGKKEILVKKYTVCGCCIYECRCHKKACKPIPKCGIYQVLRTYHTKSCCQIHVCECKGLHFCPELKPIKCHDEEVIVSETDIHQCCVIRRKCVCPKTCPIPEPPECKKTEKIVSIPTKCCNRLSCVCDKARCPLPPPCAKFETLSKLMVCDDCCERHICIPPKGCVVRNKVTGEVFLKKEGETWTESLCLCCICKKCATGYKVVCQLTFCPKCKSGYKRHPVPGKCCGICKQSHCIQEIQGKGKVLFELGERWNDNCNVYECTKQNTMFMIKVTTAVCKPVPFCKENEVQKEDECKCPTCKYEKCDCPVIINPSLTIGLVKAVGYNGELCQNTEEICGLAQCVGNCRQRIHGNPGKYVETKTTYCRNNETKIIRVVLTCPNGSTILQFLRIPVSCKCKQACEC